MMMHDLTSPPLIRPLPIRRFCTVAVMLVVYMQAPADALAGLVVTAGGIDYYISSHSTDIDAAVAAADSDGFTTDWLVRAPDETAAALDITRLMNDLPPEDVFGSNHPNTHYILRSFSDTGNGETVRYTISSGDGWHPLQAAFTVNDVHGSYHWVLTSTSSGAVPEPSPFLCFCLVGLAFGGWRKLKSDS